MPAGAIDRPWFVPGPGFCNTTESAGWPRPRLWMLCALLRNIPGGKSRTGQRWEVMMANQYSRREFLEKSSLAGLATVALCSEGAATNAMPSRVLGKTGARISILALGCGSRLLMYGTEEAAVEAINVALDS